MWGALTETSEMNLAVCWNIRLLAVVAVPLPTAGKQCSIRRYHRPSGLMVKMRPARIISREVFVTPQRLHARHPERDGDIV